MTDPLTPAECLAAIRDLCDQEDRLAARPALIPSVGLLPTSTVRALLDRVEEPTAEYDEQTGLPMADATPDEAFDLGRVAGLDEAMRERVDEPGVTLTREEAVQVMHWLRYYAPPPAFSSDTKPMQALAARLEEATW